MIVISGWNSGDIDLPNQPDCGHCSSHHEIWPRTTFSPVIINEYDVSFAPVFSIRTMLVAERALRRHDRDGLGYAHWTVYNEGERGRRSLCEVMTAIQVTLPQAWLSRCSAR